MPPEIPYPKSKRAQQRLFDSIIDAGRGGKSHAQIAEMIGISRDTLKCWIQQEADLSRIMSMADDYALAWWEALGQRQAETREGNSSVFIFVMKNRFGLDYSKDLPGEDGTGEPAANAAVLAALSPEKRNALRALLREEIQKGDVD